MRHETQNGPNDVPIQEMLDRLGIRVQHQLSGRLRNFHLKRRDHGVVLRGQARTYYAKQLAQHAVMRATELPILHNEIEVL